MAANDLVIDAPAREVVLVEEVAERPVADVVQEARKAERLLHQGRRRGVGMDLAQRWVEVPSPLAGEVHRAQGMLEPGVLRSGKTPPGALQLVDPPQPLQPGIVEDVLFGNIARYAAGASLGDPEVASPPMVLPVLPIWASRCRWPMWMLR